MSEMKTLNRIESRLRNTIAESQFTERELELLKKNFMKACSGDGRETMDRSDFSKCLGLLGSSKTRGVFANRLFDVFSGGSKRMSFDQFVACMSSMVHGDQDEKLRLVFNMCAKNSSHTITKDELRNILGALHELFDVGGRSTLNKSLELNQAVIDSIFDRLDINHDGVVEWKEFQTVVKKNPDILLQGEGDVTLPGQRLVDSIALATKIESMIDSLRKRPPVEEMDTAPGRDLKLLVHFKTKRIRCDLENVTSVRSLYKSLEEKLGSSCISEVYLLDDENNEVRIQNVRVYIYHHAENIQKFTQKHIINSEQIRNIPMKCKMRAVESSSSSNRIKTKKEKDESTDQVLKRAHVLLLRLVLSLQQLRVDVGDQLEIDSENSNSELIPLTPQDTEVDQQKDSTIKLEKETQRLQEARKLMNASGQLLSQLSKEGLTTEDQNPHQKAVKTHQSKEEFDKIMPGDSRWNKVLTVMKGIQLGAARSQGEANTKLRKFDFFTKDEYRLEAFSTSSATSNDVVCT